MFNSNPNAPGAWVEHPENSMDLAEQEAKIEIADLRESVAENR